MNPFAPHVEEAFTLILQHMRSRDPRVSIRACRTLLAADLRYKMLEYTAVRAEYTALKNQHAAPPTPPADPPEAPASSGTSRPAQRASRPPAPPRFDELREELRLAPEHRELVTAALYPDHALPSPKEEMSGAEASGRQNASGGGPPPLPASSSSTPADPIPADPPPTIKAGTRRSTAAQLAGIAGSAGASITFFGPPPTNPRASRNTT